MRIGDILLARGLVTADQVEDGLTQQLTKGGRLGDALVALGHLSADSLEVVIRQTPRSPQSPHDVGVSPELLRALMLKFMLARDIATVSAMAKVMKLPAHIVLRLMGEATADFLVHPFRQAKAEFSNEPHYELSELGREQAAEAMARCHYFGPAPVALQAYQEQILKQRVSNEQVDMASLERRFSGVSMPAAMRREIGPAVHGGGAMLLHGAPGAVGQGEDAGAIAARVGHAFEQIIYVPHAVEIDGQIMRVFDPQVHVKAIGASAEQLRGRRLATATVSDFDQRWLPIHRPEISVGGDLTLAAMDLHYNDETKTHEAPMHVKALGGVFIVDRFGHQQISPEAQLNRWTVPMQSRIDILRLRNGKSFFVPFDEVLIFSTDLDPAELMQPAFLDRIPHRVDLSEAAA